MTLYQMGLGLALRRCMWFDMISRVPVCILCNVHYYLYTCPSFNPDPLPDRVADAVTLYLTGRGLAKLCMCFNQARGGQHRTSSAIRVVCLSTTAHYHHSYVRLYLINRPADPLPDQEGSIYVCIYHICWPDRAVCLSCWMVLSKPVPCQTEMHVASAKLI